MPLDAQLQLADNSELKSLSTGVAVATAGYPMEGIIGSPAQVISPSPETDVGSITGVTDFFYLPGDVEHNQLVHADLPAVGGQSGSPIVGPNGRVIALLNSGNIVLQLGGSRAPSAALINYGQRADLLHDILPGGRSFQLANEQEYWVKQTAHYKRGFDLIVPEILARSKPKGYAKPTLVSDQTFELPEKNRVRQKDGNFQRLGIHPVTINRDVPYVLLAYASQEADLQLYLTINDQLVAQQADMKWFPTILVRLAATAEAKLWVVSPKDRDVSYRLQVYRWEGSDLSG